MLFGRKRKPTMRVKPRNEPLATLSPDELRRVREQKRLLNDAAMVASMMQCAYRVLWNTLKDKHGLPVEVELDEETGQVFEKGRD